MTIELTPLHALLLDGQGGARSLTPAEVDNWTPEQGTLWLHLDYTEEGSRFWLEHHSGLPELAIDALLAENTRPRAAVLGEHLLLALRGVNTNPGADPEDMVSIRLCISDKRIISTRKRRLMSVSRLLEDLHNGCGPIDSAELIVQLNDRLVERMGTTVETLDDQLSELELDLLAEAGSEMRHAVRNLRRQSISLRRYYAPQRDAFNQLQSERLGWLTTDTRLALREISDRLLRHIEDLDMLRERAAMAQEELASIQGEQLNQRMYVLSIISAIFLPLGFLTGLLGINVGGIPGADNENAFLMFLGALTLMVAGLFWLFRRWRWL
ncbi:zinc transporter ZntB [Marinobacterium sediminicola]|uniref:Zinc transporter n=1 Tax=Marinobacterium sediminicola TaxID=518898 RepID=A0ABY1S155_9GAMM|nr:zinc transporter ZntB [Marinobacterium sediminicola]ULG69790.1 zinc transporter ZntB [Marinobacterium sediminicola]SMR75396.1 zinc transporter [Marinobacterium sediminicola]